MLLKEYDVAVRRFWIRKLFRGDENVWDFEIHYVEICSIVYLYVFIFRERNQNVGVKRSGNTHIV